MAEKRRVNGSGTTEHSGGVAETIAAVAVIGIGAALIEVEWIPGILIGIGAMLAPKLIPGLTGAMRPVVRSAVKGGYLAAMKTREVLAEAKEEVEDIIAEVRAEQEMTSSAGNGTSHRRAESPN
jgi:Protein of unknown function (DUF5132)